MPSHIDDSDERPRYSGASRRGQYAEEPPRYSRPARPAYGLENNRAEEHDDAGLRRKQRGPSRRRRQEVKDDEDEERWGRDNRKATREDSKEGDSMHSHGDDEAPAVVDEKTKKRVQPLNFDSVLSVPLGNDVERSEKNGPLLLKCFIERKKTMMGCELLLRLDGSSEILLTAQKQTSGNYHIFDLHAGTVGRKLSKKCGNYLGKIAAATSSEPLTRLLVDQRPSGDRDELGLFLHRKCGSISAMVDGAKPRQICVVVPRPGARKRNLLKRFLVGDGELEVLDQRQPRLLNGLYSLNFFGRASIASVKNLQLNDEKNRLCFQLGKVGDDNFNLDFAEPLTPFVAFALAVSQFIG